MQILKYQPFFEWQGFKELGCGRKDLRRICRERKKRSELVKKEKKSKKVNDTPDVWFLGDLQFILCRQWSLLSIFHRVFGSIFSVSSPSATKFKPSAVRWGCLDLWFLFITSTRRASFLMVVISGAGCCYSPVSHPCPVSLGGATAPGADSSIL